MTNQNSSQIKLSTGEAEVFGNMDSVSFTNAEFIEASGTDINEYYNDEQVP